MREPDEPDAAAREELLDTLAGFVASGGPEPLLSPLIAADAQAFPEPWQPTRAAVELVLRRLFWHAGMDDEVDIDDRRNPDPPAGSRAAQTRIELVRLRGRHAEFALHAIGHDNVAGRLAHEIGIAYAVRHRSSAGTPYRSEDPPEIVVDPGADAPRGTVAAIYLGLGVVAVNAAFEKISTAGHYGAYPTNATRIERAGYLDLPSQCFLVAVQTSVRGDTEPPAGLHERQRDEVARWLTVLAARAGELRARLGIAVEARGRERPVPVRFAELDRPEPTPPQRRAFRWRSHRGGSWMVAGLLAGGGLAIAVTGGLLVPILAAAATGVGGFSLGRRSIIPRCSACSRVVAADATVCSGCRAALLGDIADPSERLEAEERLDESEP